MTKESFEFKRWLALYFIKKGNWKLTDKAIEEFGQDATPKQTMEFAEDYSSREREERIIYNVGLSRKEMKTIAVRKIEGLLEQGKAEQLLNSGYITYFAKWKDVSDRVTVVKMLVEKLKKDPRDLTQEDFNKNRLRGLLSNYYNNSPYEAVKEAGLVTDGDEKQMRNRGKFGYRDVPSGKEVIEAARKIERNAEKRGVELGASNKHTLNR